MLRVRIMGSAAAEGWPALWCGCAQCVRARKLGGKNIRTRSGVLIDDDLKIDLSPDTYMQAVRDDLDLSKVGNLLVTHAHPDHITPAELAFHRPPFAHDNVKLHVWGSKQTIDKVRPAVGNWPDRDALLHILEPFQPVTLNDGTEVMPLKAAHDPNSGPYNYIIKREGKTLFYGMDSGWFPEESWQAHKGYVFDVVIIDCTMGDVAPWWGHGTLGEAMRMKDIMLASGTAHNKTIFLANHFSHNGGLLHEEMEQRFAGSGILVAYDGMVIDL